MNRKGPNNVGILLVFLCCAESQLVKHVHLVDKLSFLCAGPSLQVSKFAVMFGAAVLFVLFYCAESQLVKHVHLVDRHGSNFLFRGGSPEVNGSAFSFGALVNSIKIAASAANTSLPVRFQLIVINVENLDDSFLSEVERRVCLGLQSRLGRERRAFSPLFFSPFFFLFF